MKKPSKVKRKFQNESGFTLIEIIVVMVILTILAALIMPGFTGRTEQARRSKGTSDIANLKVALDMYEADNGVFPTTEQGLDALREAPTSDPVPSNWKGPYLKEPLSNDPWDHPYHYVAPGDINTNSYDLISYGKDGKEGGTGDDADICSWQLGNKTNENNK